jgi:hypothetical protein
MYKKTENLEEFLEFFSENFPKIEKRKIEKILYVIWCRHVTYSTIGISRLEASRFGVSDDTLQKIINFLINF